LLTTLETVLLDTPASFAISLLFTKSPPFFKRVFIAYCLYHTAFETNFQYI